MGRLRNIGRLRAGGAQQSSTDSDAAAWAAAVTANSGTYSGTTLAAVSAFCVSAKASGYWTKLNRINLFCGDQLAAALVPLKVGGGNATETNVNFVSGDYSEATGITGNGTTKYLNTGLVASTLTTNDTHLAVYNRSGSATGGGIVIGANSGANTLEMYGPFNDTFIYSDQYNTTGGAGRISVSIAAPYGLLVGSRTASNAHSAYQKGNSVVSGATSGGSLPAVSLFVFAGSNGGTPNTFSAHALATYSIGSGLSAADVTAYNTHMQTFQTSLARNV